MPYPTKQPMLDVQDLPDTQVQWLKRIIDELKAQAKIHGNRSGEQIIFATHKSHLIGGYSRVAAYEEQ